MATTMTTKVTSRKLPRLVLHFDVNETILLGDVAGGDSFEDGINKCIANLPKKFFDHNFYIF